MMMTMTTTTMISPLARVTDVKAESPILSHATSGTSPHTVDPNLNLTWSTRSQSPAYRSAYRSGQQLEEAIRLPITATSTN